MRRNSCPECKLLAKSRRSPICRCPGVSMSSSRSQQRAAVPELQNTILPRLADYHACLLPASLPSVLPCLLACLLACLHRSMPTAVASSGSTRILKVKDTKLNPKPLREYTLVRARAKHRLEMSTQVYEGERSMTRLCVDFARLLMIYRSEALVLSRHPVPRTFAKRTQT